MLRPIPGGWIRALTLFLFFSFATKNTWAITAGASLSSTQVMAGEAFQLQVQVSDDKKEELPWPQVQGLERFQVAKSTSTSSTSQTTIVNGRISQSNAYITTFLYTLTAA